jgi:hypothetical protein
MENKEYKEILIYSNYFLCIIQPVRFTCQQITYAITFHLNDKLVSSDGTFIGGGKLNILYPINENQHSYKRESMSVINDQSVSQDFKEKINNILIKLDSIYRMYRMKYTNDRDINQWNIIKELLNTTYVFKKELSYENRTCKGRVCHSGFSEKT